MRQNPQNNAPLREGLPVAWLLDSLASRNVSVADITSALDLDHRLFSSPRVVLKVETFDKIFEWAAKATNDPALGLHMSQERSPTDFELLGYLLNNVERLDDWCELFSRYHCIYTPEYDVSFSLNPEGPNSYFYYQEGSIEGSYTQQDIDFTVGLVIKNFRDRVSEDWIPLRCWFTYPEPTDISEHIRYFGPNLHFEHSTNGFEFDSSILSRGLPDVDSGLFNILLAFADQQLDEVESRDNIVNHVKLLLSSNLQNEELSAGFIASSLGMSVRTMHNKLKLNHTTFNKIREETILALSQKVLVETNMSVTRIGEQMGYSETSAFVRMFKRAIGMSPLQYRKSSI